MAQSLKTQRNKIKFHLHHEEGLATEIKIETTSVELSWSSKCIWQPFWRWLPWTHTFNSWDCADDSVVSTVRFIECLGKKQYLKYVADVINSGQASIHGTIAKNYLSLFKSPRHEVMSKPTLQVTAQRSNASLFGCLYVANRQRDGDLGLFFRGKNQAPPFFIWFWETSYWSKIRFAYLNWFWCADKTYILVWP